MYVICESNTNGIVEIAPTDGGTFLGYFGTNYASTSLQTIIYRAILTDEQRAKMVSNIPSTPTNLAIDAKGLIYTVTRGDEEMTLKRLNIAGNNLIDGTDYVDYPTAVAAGNHDNVYVADQQGFIYEYSNDGELLFVFGGKDDGTQRIGLSTMLSSIQIDSEDRIYVLDSDKAQIQVYEPTEFTNLLHNALYLYSKGRYTESKEPLSEVLEMNSMFDYANQAMGRAYFQEENYEMALYYAKLAKDYDGYSDAFWEIRNVWLKKNIMTAIGVIVLLYIAFKLIKYLDRKKKILAKPRALGDKIASNKIINDLLYSRYFMKHPFDGSYGIAREGRASWIAPSIILGIFTAEYVINKYLCGFLQKTIREGRYEIVSDIGKIVLVIFALTVCNYLVCTINDGEGSVKKIYTYFCYSLVPYVTLVPVIFILSHVLTTNEQFLITMLWVVIVGWALILMVISMKEVNNYTPGETFKVICLTIFTILILSLLIFVIYILWAQVFEFISAIFGEVVYRLGY
jgi:tetratricopeptide (TPR) repeat protein